MKKSIEVRSILETTVSFLETKVGELQAEISQLTSSKAEVETLSSSLSLERVELLSRIGTLELDLEGAQRIQKETDNTINELRQQVEQSISALTSANAQFESTILELRQELEQSTCELATVKNQTESEVSELRRELEQSTCNLTSVKAELESTLLQHRELDGSCQLKMNEVADLMAERNELQEQLNASNDQLKQLKDLEASLVEWRLEQTHLPVAQHQEELIMLSDYPKHLKEMTTLCDTYKVIYYSLFHVIYFILYALRYFDFVDIIF